MTDVPKAVAATPDAGQRSLRVTPRAGAGCCSWRAVGTSIFIVPAFVPGGVTSHFFADVMMTLILICGVLAIADHRRRAITLAVLSVRVIAIRAIDWFVPIELQAPWRYTCRRDTLA